MYIEYLYIALLEYIGNNNGMGAIIFTVLNAGSAVVSAIATWKIYRLTEQAKKSQEEAVEQTSDLYKAIVISTLLSSNTDTGQFPTFLSKFNDYYDGKTRIFKEK